MNYTITELQELDLIENVGECCVYCHEPSRDSWRGCCGEIHFEEMYLLKAHDRYYTKDEVLEYYNNTIELPKGAVNT